MQVACCRGRPAETTNTMAASFQCMSTGVVSLRAKEASVAISRNIVAEPTGAAFISAFSNLPRVYPIHENNWLVFFAKAGDPNAVRREFFRGLG